MQRPLPETHGVVLLGAVAGGLLVAQQVAGKAARDALFLSSYPPRALPLVMMAASLVSVAVALGTGRLLSARGPRRAVEALIAVNATLLLLDFLLASWSLPLAAVLVYLQVAAAGGTLTSGYWSVVNERFDPWTAKRVVGRLGLGTSVGAVAGGIMAWAMAGLIPLPAMLLLMAGLNVAALVFVVRFAGDAPGPRTPTDGAGPSPPGTLRAAPYLRNLALLVALGAATEALLDYVLKSRAAASLPSGPELMAFFAAFHTGVGLVGLGAQSLATRPALETLGLAGAVALRPLAVALASVVGVVDPRLWSAVLGRGGHDVITNSVFRSGYELLYTPLPEPEKRAAKPLVDVAADKLGALLGGALALLAVRALAAPERALFLLAGGLSLLAFGLTARLHRGYVAALEESLRAGRVRLDLTEVVDSTTRLTLVGTHATLGDWKGLRPPAGSAASPEDPAVAAGSGDPADPILWRIADLRSAEPARIRRALSGASVDSALVPHLVPLLARGDVYLDVVRALRQVAPRATGQLADTLLDPDADPVVRRRLPRVLKASPTRRAVDALLLGLGDPSPEVRSACGLALATLTSRVPELRVSGEVVFAAARREMERTTAPGVLDHVFVLFSLVLEREPLRIASSVLRGEDKALKGTALEYLENVLPGDVSAALMAFMGVAPASGRIRALQDVLSDLRRRR